MSSAILYKGNTSKLRLIGLADQDGAYISGATVTLVSFTSQNGTAVPGLTYPVAMPYVPASDGEYECTLPSNLAVKVGRMYSAELKALISGVQGLWHESVLVKRRND